MLSAEHIVFQALKNSKSWVKCSRKKPSMMWKDMLMVCANKTLFTKSAIGVPFSKI